MKKTGKQWFFIVTILIFALTYCAFFGISNYYGDKKNVYVKSADDIRWGIDIRGGVEGVFSPDMDLDKVTAKQLEDAETVIKNRMIGQGITDYETFVDATNKQVIVRFPWSADRKSFDATTEINKLGETAVVTFREGSQDPDGAVVLQGAADIKSASVSYDENAKPQVQLKLTSAGASKFATATSRLASSGGSISIYRDEECISWPTVNSAITNGEAVITGMSSVEEATELASEINAGTLPFALTIDDSKIQVVSATLGEEALNVMVLAGIIAFAVICLIMLFRYRLAGVVTCIALLGQVGGMIACVTKFFPGTDSFTLTIPGLAGIILSIGMGVDANVITNERIREEIKRGKTIGGAINSGGKNSVAAIIDGNMTNVIVSVVLMGAFGPSDSIFAKIFGFLLSPFGASVTGSIYSFGYTLLIGVVLNFIMGVLAAQIMLKSLASFKCLRKPSLYGVKVEKTEEVM